MHWHAVITCVAAGMSCVITHIMPGAHAHKKKSNAMCSIDVHLLIMLDFHGNAAGQVGGYVEVYDGLTFSTVRNAGHMVPYTQAERAYYMFSHWIHGKNL